MRIGAIAQHSMIGGPTRPSNIITNNIPGRLNDFPIWVWYDFTDPATINNISYPGGSPEVASFAPLSLTRVADKGRYSATLISEAAGKGPEWYDANYDDAGLLGSYANAISSQDNYSYIRSSTGTVGYMQFTNPVDLSTTNFTAIVVLDKFGTPSDDEFIFKLFGTGGEFISLSTNTSNKLSWKINGGSKTYNNFWTDTTGGDSNSNFTWIALVGNYLNASYGYVDLYSRGTLYSTGGTTGESLASYGNGGMIPQNPNTFAKNGFSVILGSDNNTDEPDDSDSPSAYMYEFLIYNKALTAQDLYSFDRYIGDKYGSYAHGRFGDI